MPSKYWIKLYQEILEDPKMGRLPDNLWRRTIELFLLAGELGSDLEELDRGHLPATGEIAWRLRQPEEELEAELCQLAAIGILTQTASGWLVTNFVKRQEYVKPAERMKQYRERKREKELNSPAPAGTELVTRIETKRNAEVEVEIEIESTSKEVGASPPPVVKPVPKTSRPEEIPAARVFREVVGKFVLNNTQIREIDERVGRDPPALEKWRETVKAWQLAGNKINGIKGMLDWFRDGIPVYQKARTNGTHKVPGRDQRDTKQSTPGGLSDRPDPTDPAAWAAMLKGK